MKNLERFAIEGDSPVFENGSACGGILSIMGHVVSREDLGSPLSKAKYELLTDSELVP